MSSSSLPISTGFSNTATGAGTYLYLDPSRPLSVFDKSSEVVVTAAPIRVTGEADREEAVPGDTVSYTFTVANGAVFSLGAVKLTDLLPPALELVPDSVNPPPEPCECLESGVSLPDIPPGGEAVLRLRARVRPGASGTVENSASLSAVLCVDGAAQDIRLHTAAAAVEVYSVGAALILSASQQKIRIGDVLTYTVRAVNSSRVPLENLIVFDRSLDASLTVGEIRLDGMPVPSGETLPAGVPIGTLAPGASATLTFSALVGAQAPDLLVSHVCAAYDYTVGGEPHRDEVSSSSVGISLIKPSLSLIKTADKSVVSVSGESVTYTVIVTNTGNVPIDGVTVTDPIPEGMTYTPGSTYIGCAECGQDLTPARGIPVGTLVPGQTVTVRFSVTVSLQGNY